MPNAFAVNGTKPSRIYSSPPSYFLVQTVSPLKMILLPKVLLWKLPIQRPIIWMIYTNMFMNHSEIYRTAIIIYIQLCELKSECYNASGFTIYNWREFRVATTFGRHFSRELRKEMIIWTKCELLLRDCIWMFYLTRHVKS